MLLPRPSAAMSVPSRPPSLAPSLPMHGSMHAPVSPTNIGDSTAQHLCPDLVVPDSSECCLLVPYAPLTFEEVVTVDDARGMPVFKVTTYLDVSSGPFAPVRTVQMVLANAQGEAVFASCMIKEEGGPAPLVSLVTKDEQANRFATLSAAGPELFMLTMVRGLRIQFRLERMKGGVKFSIYDEDRPPRLLAIAEPLVADAIEPSRKRVVRVGPQVDAGLIVLSMMGIDALSASHGRSFSR